MGRAPGPISMAGWCIGREDPHTNSSTLQDHPHPGRQASKTPCSGTSHWRRSQPKWCQPHAHHAPPACARTPG